MTADHRRNAQPVETELPQVAKERLKDLDPAEPERTETVRGGGLKTLPQASYRHTCFACELDG